MGEDKCAQSFCGENGHKSEMFKNANQAITRTVTEGWWKTVTEWRAITFILSRFLNKFDIGKQSPITKEIGNYRRAESLNLSSEISRTTPDSSPHKRTVLRLKLGDTAEILMYNSSTVCLVRSNDKCKLTRNPSLLGHFEQCDKY